jgi:hypothetical protein
MALSASFNARKAHLPAAGSARKKVLFIAPGSAFWSFLYHQALHDAMDHAAIHVVALCRYLLRPTCNGIFFKENIQLPSCQVFILSTARHRWMIYKLMVVELMNGLG